MEFVDFETYPLRFFPARRLRDLGFRPRTCSFILQSWYTSPTADEPHSLLGEALTVIAQLGEDEDNTSPRPFINGVTCKKGPPRSKWDRIFAEVFTSSTRAIIQEIGVFNAPDWVQAKYIVGRMFQRNWAILAGLEDTDDLEPAPPTVTIFRYLSPTSLWYERILADHAEISKNLSAETALVRNYILTVGLPPYSGSDRKEALCSLIACYRSYPLFCGWVDKTGLQQKTLLSNRWQRYYLQTARCATLSPTPTSRSNAISQVSQAISLDS